MSKPVGFYRDRKGRIRPITRVTRPLTKEEAQKISGIEEYDLDELYPESDEELSPARVVLKRFLERRPMASELDMVIAITMAGHSKDTANEVIREFEERKARKFA